MQEVQNLMSRARIAGWLMLGGYVAVLLEILRQIDQLSHEVLSFYLIEHLIGLAALGMVVYLLYRSERAIWRVSIIVLAVIPHLLECLLISPPNNGLLWWSILVSGFGAIILMRADELKHAMLLIGFVSAVSITIGFINPYVAIFPANPLSHGSMRFGLLSGAMGAAVMIGITVYRSVQTRLREKESDLERTLAQKESLLENMEQLWRTAEQHRMEAQNALAEAERLRIAEHRRAEREAFLSRYEQLMRLSYMETLDSFCRRILESFSTEMPLIGGLFYVREREQWRVSAAYGFPDRVGKVLEVPLLRTAEITGKPHLIYPVPESIPLPAGAVVRPKAQVLLYIPFTSEATGEVTGVAELLLASLPTAEMLSRIEDISGRVGTYLWIRQGGYRQAKSGDPFISSGGAARTDISTYPAIEFQSVEKASPRRLDNQGVSPAVNESHVAPDPHGRNGRITIQESGTTGGTVCL